MTINNYYVNYYNYCSDSNGVSENMSDIKFQIKDTSVIKLICPSAMYTSHTIKLTFRWTNVKEIPHSGAAVEI